MQKPRPAPGRGFSCRNRRPRQRVPFTPHRPTNNKGPAYRPTNNKGHTEPRHAGSAGFPLNRNSSQPTRVSSMAPGKFQCTRAQSGLRSPARANRTRTRGGIPVRQRPQAVTHNKAEEYRRHAQECLEVARPLSPETGRATLIEMARTWLRLAEEQEISLEQSEPKDRKE
jgi:hypothetical protein